MPDGTLQDGVNITERGAARLKLLLADEKNPNAKFRVSVLGGGCSGFQYSFSFDDVLNSDDKVFERNGVPIVVDEISLDLLGGAVVPNAERSLAKARETSIQRREAPPPFAANNNRSWLSPRMSIGQPEPSSPKRYSLGT